MNLQTILTHQERIHATFNLLSPELFGSLIILFFLFQTASTLDALIKHYIGITKVDLDKKHQLQENVVINVALLSVLSFFILVC